MDGPPERLRWRKTCGYPERRLCTRCGRSVASDLDQGIEELAVLVEGEAVGHARDVVAHRAIGAVGGDALLVLRRKLQGLPHVGLEEVAQDAPRLVAHP